MLALDLHLPFVLALLLGLKDIAFISITVHTCNHFSPEKEHALDFKSRFGDKPFVRNGGSLDHLLALIKPDLFLLDLLVRKDGLYEYLKLNVIAHPP